MPTTARRQRMPTIPRPSHQKKPPTTISPMRSAKSCHIYRTPSQHGIFLFAHYTSTSTFKRLPGTSQPITSWQTQIDHLVADTKELNTALNTSRWSSQDIPLLVTLSPLEPPAQPTLPVLIAFDPNHDWSRKHSASQTKDVKGPGRSPAGRPTMATSFRKPLEFSAEGQVGAERGRREEKPRVKLEYLEAFSQNSEVQCHGLC